MNFIQKNSKKFQVDISGPRGNALCLIEYLIPFMGKEDAMKFVRNNEYLTSVGQMAYFYDGYDIITDLGEQDLKAVEVIVDNINKRNKQKHEQRKILQSIVQDDAFQPQLSV